MSVLNVKPKFLYPNSRQFPFDEVTEKIVKVLEKRNFKVPGITVDFYTYGSGEEKYKKVQCIKGDNFKLCFCRKQRSLNKKFNDTAAANEIYIPKQNIKVYSDESGPTYYLYVGNDWNKDKGWFMNSTKVHSKLKGEPRRYLKYRGNTYNTRATELLADDDLEREYSPLENEPKSFNLEEKFIEFTSWLEENVLKYILSFPEEDIIEEKTPELIPYKGPWDTIYSLCDEKDANRIMQGKEDKSKLPLSDRHAEFGSGHRLVSLFVKGKEGIPEIAYDGFIWCDVNPVVNKKEDILPCVLSEMGSFFGKIYIVAISLKYANGVYVADNSKYTKTREKLFEYIAPRDRLTDEEFDEVLAARGATIVPITEYKGDYEEPIVLINRELDFDEIDNIFFR